MDHLRHSHPGRWPGWWPGGWDQRPFWTGAVSLTALVMLLPVLVILAHFFEPAGAVWTHLAETVLAEYVSNSLLLMIGVAVGTTIGGVGTAWLVSMCNFPGRAIFEWSLLLPMALPAYIIAYTYTDLLDFAGPIQSSLRSLTGWGYRDYWFPEIRSLGGAVVMMSLVLYPYVYLLARAAFLNQSVCVLEVGRTLGNGPWRNFWTVALPLARPAIVAGLALALMEALADYGTVEFFGVPTFTTGIFRTWYGFGDAVAAAQLSVLLLAFIALLLAVEQISRAQSRFHHTSGRLQDIRRMRLSKWPAAAAFGVCFFAVAFGFLVPAGQLLWWSFAVAVDTIDDRFLVLAGNSLLLGAVTAGLSVGLALFLAYGRRIQPNPITKTAVRAAGLGYALPGTVIALGVVLPVAWLDNRLDEFFLSMFGVGTGLLFSGSLVALIFAYLVRFLAISLQTVTAGLVRIRPSLEEAGRSLGAGPASLVWRLHVPMLRGSLLTALLLVFVDVLKELPATLILRPFNFNTLAVRAYEMASDERLADAGPAALAIVAAGLVPVLLLSRSIGASRRSLP